MPDPTPPRPDRLQPAAPATPRNDEKVLCDRCGEAMYRMHAVWRCSRCGYKTDCCGW
jgi:formylmethanofuran dehydrogenase subunit E